MQQIHVIKKDGSKVPLDINQLKMELITASEGLPAQIEKVAQIIAEVQMTIFDGIKQDELAQTVIQVA